MWRRDLRRGKTGKMTVIVHSLEPITLVGAGTLQEPDFAKAFSLAPRIVAADGGAAHCLRLGHVPEAVIGDMDSLEQPQIADIPKDRVNHITDQDSTDFDKTLRSVAAPVAIGVGFSGDRIDHQLACYNVMVTRAHQRCILVGAADIVCVAPPRLQMDLTAGTRVSLFPLRAVRGTSRGLQWPIDQVAFAPDGPIGTSNMATGPIDLHMQAAGMLLILPKVWLAYLVSCLLSQPEGWRAL